MNIPQKIISNKKGDFMFKSYSKTQLCLMLAALIVFLVPIIFLVCTWRTIPGEISTHFGALGQADATGSKMILPILVLMEMFLFFFQMVLSLIPGIINQNPKALEKKSGSIYYHIRSFFCILTLITNVIFGYIIIQIARQKSLGSWFLPAVIIGVTVPIIYYVVKIVRAGK